MPSKVLLATDSAETGRIWAYGLQQRRIACIVVASEPEVQVEIQWAQHVPDLVIIDAYSEALDAITLCRRLHAHLANPILMLSSRTEEGFILAAYDAGVDEYILRPISVPLFLAKVQSWLRRSWMVPIGTLEARACGGFELDPERRQVVTAGGVAVRLTNLEFRLLYLLMSQPRRVCAADLLLDCIWGGSTGDHVALKNVVYRLRHKIEPDPAHPRHIQTIGVGYLFDPG